MPIDLSANGITPPQSKHSISPPPGCRPEARNVVGVVVAKDKVQGQRGAGLDNLWTGNVATMNQGLRAFGLERRYGRDRPWQLIVRVREDADLHWFQPIAADAAGTIAGPLTVSPPQ